MSADPGPVPFQANLELLRLFLTRRAEIVDSIEAVLNAQRKPIRYLQDHSLLSRDFENCFLARAAATAGQLRLRGQLEEAHWAAGFKPRSVHDLHNDLIHPAEMMIRAFYCWQQTRWPGRSGRLHYAHTLFNLYVLRWLQFLSMRLWDAVPAAGSQAERSEPEGPGSPSARLAEIQAVLDALWKTSPAAQPALVRDARWLIPLAQSLITDELAPYFEVARQVTDTLPEADALEIHRAHVRMIGGHLTSQIRYYCTKDSLPIHAHSVVLRTRTSNALDFALLVHGLVRLLHAYDRALQSGDQRTRLAMAGAICQGVSADPELFLNRVDLLSAYTMIEHVFIGMDGAGQVVYSPPGVRHVRLLKEYGALMERLIHPLRGDLPRFRPVDGRYSPYGMIFGLPSHLIEHMALKAIQHDAETRFSLEDVFEDDVFEDAVHDPGDRSAAKLAWVNGWRQLPHIQRQVQQLYDYPQPFAQDIYHRIESEFSETSVIKPRDANASPRGAPRTGRLYLSCKDAPEMGQKEAAIPELEARYFVSSESRPVAAHTAEAKAEPSDPAQLLAARREGHFLVSYETPGGWIALKKELLTEVLGAGRDALVAGLPPGAAEALRLTCADLIVPESGADRASGPQSIEKAGS